MLFVRLKCGRRRFTTLDLRGADAQIAIMRAIVLTLSLLASAPAAVPAWAATGCEDIWFTRNLIMDRAGYCFNSLLGRALFNNADCQGQNVTLDPLSASVVAQIRGLEAQHNCRVDVNRSWIDMEDIAFRRVLTNLPIYTEWPSACTRWLGGETPLYAGYSEPFQQIGVIQPGNWVSYSHLGVSDWAYVTVDAYSDGPFVSAGWLYWRGSPPCEQMIP